MPCAADVKFAFVASTPESALAFHAAPPDSACRLQRAQVYPVWVGLPTKDYHFPKPDADVPAVLSLYRQCALGPALQ